MGENRVPSKQTLLLNLVKKFKLLTRYVNMKAMKPKVMLLKHTLDSRENFRYHQNRPAPGYHPPKNQRLPRLLFLPVKLRHCQSSMKKMMHLVLEERLRAQHEIRHFAMMQVEVQYPMGYNQNSEHYFQSQNG